MIKKERMITGLLSMLVCLVAAAVVLAAVLPAEEAFADDDEDRAFGNLYILGRKITASGVVAPETVPHEGTITYDADNKVLKLSGVTLDLNDYDSQSTENNYVAGISSWSDLKIELEGQNYIKSSTNIYGDDKEYVYGITGHSGVVSVGGSGFLDVTLDSVSGKEFTGISVNRGLEVNRSVIHVHIKGTQASTGIDMGISDFMLSGQAKVGVQADGEGSTAVDGCGMFARSYVCESSVLEATSDDTAFFCYLLSDDLKDTPTFVNGQATHEGAQPWDKETVLPEYKYVRFDGNEGGPSRASGSVYILGRTISESGEVPESTVPHKGTILYDKDTKTVTLKDAMLDLDNYKCKYKGNILPAIYSTSDLHVVLQGTNQIISTGEDYARYEKADPKDKKEYVYGVEAWDAVDISGDKDATLWITLAKTNKDYNKKIKFAGIDTNGSVQVDSVWIGVNMGSYGNCTGVYSWGPIFLTNGAAIRANADGADGCAVSGTNDIGKTEVAEDSMLEMISNGKAFNCWTPEESLKNTPCVVNTAPSEDGAAQWDKSTWLHEYKYVMFGTKNERVEPDPEPVVKKKTNTLKVSGKKVKLSAKKLKKKAKTIKRKSAITVIKAKGPVTYKLSGVTRSKFKKYFKVASKSGNITVKNGLKKGTYKVKVKVTAAGTKVYKAGSKIATVTVKVK